MNLDFFVLSDLKLFPFFYHYIVILFQILYLIFYFTYLVFYNLHILLNIFHLLAIYAFWNLKSLLKLCLDCLIYFGNLLFILNIRNQVNALFKYIVWFYKQAYRYPFLSYNRFIGKRLIKVWKINLLALSLMRLLTKFKLNLIRDIVAQGSSLIYTWWILASFDWLTRYFLFIFFILIWPNQHVLLIRTLW